MYIIDHNYSNFLLESPEVPTILFPHILTAINEYLYVYFFQTRPHSKATKVRMNRFLRISSAYQNFPHNASKIVLYKTEQKLQL